MDDKILPLIQPFGLIALKQIKSIVLVDASAGPGSEERYLNRHLEGAIYVDLEKQLADKKTDPANGGRHPLPLPAEFSKILQQLGIAPGSHVIIYDDKNGANAAARFWWMLKAAGHNAVQVLDGGMEAAIAAGFQVSSREETVSIAEAYQIGGWQLPLAEMSEVAQVAGKQGFIVIDVRDEVRFRGEKEPIDLVAGHIPGAINIPLTGNLDNDGFFLSSLELRDKYLHALGNLSPENIIVHCGSGVTACHTILAMAHAEMEIPKLYVGSWSEWSRNDQPIGKGA